MDAYFTGFVGEYHPAKNDDSKHLLYTHKNFVIKYNNNQVL
jgi:transmembrane 9 superfamily protein 3